MPLVLTTFGASDPIDATELRARNESVRRYVGEGIVAGDRAAGALTAPHVYRPDFFADHTTLTSGAHWYGSRGPEVTDQLFWTNYIGTSASGGFYIPALTRTIQIPENISTNGGHKVKVQASFAIWEFGGANTGGLVPACDETTYRAWTVDVAVNGVVQGQAQVGYKGSDTGGTSAAPGTTRVPLYPRKQTCLVREVTLNAGTHDIGIMILLTDGVDPYIRHRIVGQGNILIGYNWR